MIKTNGSSKVKKTLIRNYEQKVKPNKQNVLHDVACSKSPKSNSGQKENELGQPSLCSSEALANYLCDVKKSQVPPLSNDALNIDKQEVCTKITKKLNFHFNDKMYKNLVELNGNIDENKRKKDRKPLNITSIKKDLEPNIEDFYEDKVESDSPPKITIIRPKFKPLKKVENRHLHELMASFEDL